MALPIPPSYNNPIPNNPFYSDPSYILEGAYYPFIVGSGLSVSPDGTISASGGGGGAVNSVTAGAGISVAPTTGNVVVTNAGVTSLTAGAGILISGSTGSVTISSTNTGTVTSVLTGAGLTGGPITGTGTISLANTGVTAGTYTNPSINVNAQGQITSASSGTAVTAVTGSTPISVTAGTTPVVSIAAATTTNAGAVLLSDSVLSLSSGEAATSLAVKTAYDAAVAAIPKACVTAKGSLVTGTAASVPVALPVGTDGQVLVACSGSSSGLCWSETPQACPNTYGTVYGKTNFSNTQLGQLAGQAIQNLPGRGATLIGFCAGSILDTGTNSSTAVGVAALSLSTCSSFVTAIGDRAMCCAGNTIENVALGTLSLSVVTGNCNTALGSLAGCGLLTGCSNVFVGRNAASANTGGNRNVVIGADVTTSSPTTNCELVIGYNAGCNWLTGDSTKAIKPGAGIIDCAGSCGTAGQVLSSNGGNAIEWVTGGGGGASPATPTVAGIVLGCTLSTVTAIGSGALGVNTGAFNTAFGVNALCSNTTGARNVAVGTSALLTNVGGGNNVAIGVSALNQSTGGCNTAIGSCSLIANTAGNHNTAVGFRTLYCSTSTGFSVALGSCALHNNTTGCFNTAIGAQAMCANTTGNGNVVVGSLNSAGTYAPVFNVTGVDNRVVMGSSAVTDAYVQVAWTVVSDARDKIVEGTVPHGLGFVENLEPKAFYFKETRDSDTPHGRLRYGFLAQEVLALEGENGVIIDNEDPEKLRYNGEALVPVLVNAIKELSAELTAIKAELATLKANG